ncbi:putative DNA/RNA-binding protein [Pseudomonas phage vB_PsyM_KIL2]|uniref:Putative DNA/RNA-binding protein n=1 Tax=Pseudomonas phage vB_PsyM_KIL2 TaxID=1777066 RepID=A0A142IDZ3_9CAUD|nr:putative DNA/RNA-binding protein [Pseudomonas phage vB_PsyM_KIL2]
MKSKIHGVGINDCTYEAYKGKNCICPYFHAWKGLLSRHIAKGVPVAEEWLTFSTFKGWMETQDWEGKELDKDLLGHYTIGYTPATCCFLPKEVNIFMQDRRKSKSGLPIGVSMSRQGKFKAYADSFGVGNYLGTFNTKEEAHNSWILFKNTHAHKLADRLESEGYSQIVCNGLRTKYNGESYEPLQML